MNKEWIELSKTLNKVIDYRGKTPKKLGFEWSETGYRALSALNVKTNGLENLDSIKYASEELYKKWMKEEIQRGDILLTSEAPAGQVMVWDSDEKIVLSQRLFALRLNSEYDNYFIKYFLQSDIGQKEINKNTTGSTVFGISAKMFDLIKVPKIKKERQVLIGKILKSLDAKIELNNKVNRELEAMAKTLYDYWFVLFDFPDANGRPYKSSGGKMVYNAELKREIPEGWENGTLGDISDLVRGVTYDASDIKEENDYDVIPILRATNISGNVIDLDNMVFVPKQNVSANQVLNKFDILITMSSGSKDHIGKNGFFYFDKEVAFGAFCAKIVAKDKYRFYVYSYTQSDFMFSTIKNECLGTNINNLNGSIVKGFKIVIPPVDLVEKFNNEVLSIYEMIGNNHKQNQQLSELRDWLLPMLMNGQVMVKEAEDPDSYRENMAAEPSSNFGN